MRIQTFSVLVGSAACNARCPYCISKMTPLAGVKLQAEEPNWRNFQIGCKFAKDSGVSTVLLTGKGEPTLFPDQITDFIANLRPYGFPFIELQTNGISFWNEKEKYEGYLKKWYELGLTMIAISIVHYDNQKNREVFQPEERCIDLAGLISYLHSFGFSVRLSATMLKGIIDSPNEVLRLVNFAKDNMVEQLSVRPVAMPQKSESPEVAKWVFDHKLENTDAIKEFLAAKGKELMRLTHGAIIYDLDGQNICLTNALTIEPSSEDVRQLIFFPDGHLRYDWQYPGAILL